MPMTVGCNEVLGITVGAFLAQARGSCATQGDGVLSATAADLERRLGPALRRKRQTDFPAARREQRLFPAKRYEQCPLSTSTDAHAWRSCTP
jgi:hypothetical protein